MKTRTKVDKEEQILLALLENQTREKAAASIGMSTSTLWRWLQKPGFRERFRLARRALYSHALGRMVHATPVAIATLVRVSRDPTKSAAIHLRAAKCLLKHADSFGFEEVQAQFDSLPSDDDISPNHDEPTKLVVVGGDRTARKTGRGEEKTQRLIVALLKYGSYKEAAEALGISPSTVWRWLQKPEFQEEYRKARCEVFAINMVSLQKTVNGAISTVLAILVDKNSSAGSQISAADLVMKYATTCGRGDLQSKVDQMERSQRKLAA